MSLSLFSDIERITGENAQVWLSVLEGQYSQELNILRPIGNVYSTVYGRESGEQAVVSAGVIQAIVVNDGFYPVDLRSAGTFDEGWLFTTSEIVKVGDLIEAQRDDHRTRRFRVSAIQSLGQSQSVFHKMRLSSLGD